LGEKEFGCTLFGLARLPTRSSCFIVKFQNVPMVSKVSKNEFDSPAARLLSSIAKLRQQPTSKGAHFYRTSLRRFQAWSDAFRPPIDSTQRPVLKFLGKLRKVAGKLRDSEVQLDLLDQLPGNSAEKRKLKKTLKSSRRSYRKKLKTVLRDPALTVVRRALRAVHEPRKTGDNAELQSLGSAERLALDEYRAYVGRRSALTPENLHEYRLECKRFRYIAELAGDLPDAKELVDTWKRVQDVIGDWHDYLMLTDLAEEVLGDSRLRSSLLELRDKKYAESVTAVEEAENKLIERPAPALKKQARGVRPIRRSSSAA
jgi:CHAD domain-containing protein